MWRQNLQNTVFPTYVVHCPIDSHIITTGWARIMGSSVNTYISNLYIKLQISYTPERPNFKVIMNTVDSIISSERQPLLEVYQNSSSINGKWKNV